MSELSATNQLSVDDALEQDPGATLAMKDSPSEEARMGISPLAQYIESRFEIAKLAKRPAEARCLMAYQNFRGMKVSSTSFTQSEISKAFIKISKTKTIAAYGQLCEVIFVDGKLPIEIVASPEPQGVPEYAHIDPQDPVENPDQPPQIGSNGFPDEAVLGFPGDGKDLKPGETIRSRTMDWFKSKFSNIAKLKAGAGDSPNRIVLRPAQRAAAIANKRIHDQLADMYVVTTVRQSALELTMLGTGIIKGPFNVMKEYPDWDGEGNYIPYTEEMPNYKHVSFWDLYPDPEARKVHELGWMIERHKLSKSALRSLKKNESFMPSEIDAAIDLGPDYVKEDFENVLDETNQEVLTDRFQVLEFWGTIDESMVDSMGLNMGFDWPDDADEMDVNVWLCNGRIIRFVLNPFRPSRLPYLIAPWEFNPYSIFGVGIPENMEDTQILMNGFMRLAVDNAVLSGTIMLEADMSSLEAGQSLKIESGKIFRRNVPGNQPVIRPVQIQNTSTQNMQMFDVARRLADESTGIPSFSHGMTGVQGVGRTAGGISMLLNAASLNTKTAVKNLDDYWFFPMGKGLYEWNLQHKYDPNMKGDVSVIAKGTANLAQKSTKLQNMIQGAQIIAGIPPAAAWVNWKEYVKDMFKLLEIDTEVTLNRPDEYQLAMQLQMLMNQKQQGAQQGQPQEPGGAPMSPATPGDPRFTGTPQEQGGVDGANTEELGAGRPGIGFS